METKLSATPTSSPPPSLPILLPNSPSQSSRLLLTWQLIPPSPTVFPSEETVAGVYDHDTIRSLVRSSIRSSACSSFVALSGNSDERLFPGPEDNRGDEDGMEHVPIDQLLKVQTTPEFISITHNVHNFYDQIFTH